MRAITVGAWVAVLGTWAAMCAQSPHRTPASDATDAARRAVLSSLRDPESARFGAVATNARGIVCGTVNARNGFGGYSGDAGFFYDPATGRATVADLTGDWGAKGNQAAYFASMGCSIGADQVRALEAHAALAAAGSTGRR